MSISLINDFLACTIYSEFNLRERTETKRNKGTDADTCTPGHCVDKCIHRIHKTTWIKATINLTISFNYWNRLKWFELLGFSCLSLIERSARIHYNGWKWDTFKYICTELSYNHFTTIILYLIVSSVQFIRLYYCHHLIMHWRLSSFVLFVREQCAIMRIMKSVWFVRDSIHSNIHKYIINIDCS